MNNQYLGIDTSNYTTSVALYDGTIDQNKKLLPVKQGQLGLRQSDAVYHHVEQLPEVGERILRKCHAALTAIGVSTRPRDCEGSYMPCFRVGYGLAKNLSDLLGVPLYDFSHQSGHIVAALYGADRLSLLGSKFLAYHVSGGTTEAVLVTPDKERVIHSEIVSQSMDLKGGQAVDRVGQLLGLPFPAGKALEELALQWTEPMKLKPTMKELDFCLSGLENQCQTLKKEGKPDAMIARYCLEAICAALEESCKRLQRIYGDLPVLFAGGVMSNSIIRQKLTKKFGAYFAPPEFSTDNAAGTAILAAIKHGESI